MTAKIALIQMTSTDDLQQNKSKAFYYIEKAAEAGACLVAFPECFLFLGAEDRDEEVAVSLNSPLVQSFQTQAIENEIDILMGSILEKNPANPNKCFNTSVFINKKGEIKAVYRKIHLFDVNLPKVSLLESKRISPGKEVVTCDHEIGKIGLSICYDLRFPCLYQRLTEQGAKLIFIPSAFTIQTGQHHWIALLRARAIENQVYIAAPAQVGFHNKKRQSFGNTALISPWGDIKAIAGDKEEMLECQLDMKLLDKVRQNMPVISHKVPGVDFIL